MPGASAAVSTHPVPVQAAGEVLGQLLDAGAGGADLLLVLVTPHHGGALEDLAGAARSLVRPAVLAGAVVAWTGAAGTAPSGADGTPTVAACALAGVEPVARRSSGGPPALRVAVGGAALGGPAAGPVALDDRAEAAGTVTVDLAGPGVRLVSDSGLRPLGPPVQLTGVDGRSVRTVDGVPALERLVDLARDALPAGRLPTLGRGLQLDLGWRRTAVLGRDPAGASLLLADPIPEGATARFAVPDPDAAAGALRRAGGGALGAGPPEVGRLLVGGAGRSPSTARSWCWWSPGPAGGSGTPAPGVAALALSPAG